jgi:hypothetical protein
MYAPIIQLRETHVVRCETHAAILIIQLEIPDLTHELEIIAAHNLHVIIAPEIVHILLLQGAIAIALSEVPAVTDVPAVAVFAQVAADEVVAAAEEDVVNSYNIILYLQKINFVPIGHFSIIRNDSFGHNYLKELIK